MKISGIYKITNTVNGKIYIGLSKNITKRFQWHKYHLRRNTHENFHLQHSWNKYGESSFLFEIIEKCSPKELGKQEKYWIDFYGGFESENLYNMRDGGETGNTPTKEVIERIRKSNLGKPCVWKGKHLPKEMVEKIKNAQIGRKLTPEHREKAVSTLREYWKDKPGYWTGKTITEEHRQKLRESHMGQISHNKGKKASEETRQKLRESHMGHKHSEEVRKKISIGHKGMIFSDEHRKKLSEANKGKKRNWLNKDGVDTTVPPEKVEEYLAMGWKRGRCSKRVWITNGVESKMVSKEKLKLYDMNVWRKGRIKS